jgi:hypothetical protein
MWLRDAIPKRFNHMRCLTYGYDSQVCGSESFQTISNLALALIHRMRSIDLLGRSAKPVLFLAHSLGGIVLKETIVRLANNPALEATFLPRVNSIILFGVPNRGMEISHLLPMVEYRSNEPLIQSLCKDSPFLAQLDEQFYGITLQRNMEIISIYETHKTQIPQVSKLGQIKFKV